MGGILGRDWGKWWLSRLDSGMDPAPSPSLAVRSHLWTVGRGPFQFHLGRERRFGRLIAPRVRVNGCSPVFCCRPAWRRE